MQFNDKYTQLNQAQKQAVDTLDGPVLVIAGPGTGKTELLSMRVANILKRTDTDARNILCLTFTNKAATNMRERLQKLTDGEARNVHVKTFHGFASEIMNSYSEYFWNGANLESAPEAVELSILESIFNKLPFDNPYASKFYGKFTMLSTAQKGIARAKEAGLTPEKLRVLLAANISYIDEIENEFVSTLSQPVSRKKLDELSNVINELPEQPIDPHTAPLISLGTKIKESLAFAISQDEPTTKATNVSNWKKQWITSENGVKGMHRERRLNQKWLELASIYEQYRDELHSRGYYDYSDMLLEVIVQIEQRSDLRAEVQERFNYVLIDEFQDSNAAQLRLAHLVADHVSSEGRPNIMAVGDDDQSIYGFNGAELNNMLHFERTYGKTAVQTIVLTENYRSTQNVLQTADAIIQNSTDRLVNRIEGLTKDLVARAENLPAGQIIHTQYVNQEHQQFMVSRDIQKMWTKNSDQSIAVLARSHKSLEPLAAQLTSLGVPVSYERQQNILQHEAVVQVINICRALQAIIRADRDTLSAVLSQMLRHPMFCIEPETLWNIAEENRYESFWMESLLAREETKPLGDWLNKLATDVTNQPLAITIEQILGIRDDATQSYFKHYYIEDQQITTPYIQTLSAVRLLRQLVSEFAPDHDPSLDDFILFVDTEIANNKTISDNSAFISTEKAVELLSVHKAKGLEFDTVYIVDSIEKNWQPSGRREGTPANLPLQPPLETEDEYVRLLYVATTRAKHTINFTSYRTDHSGEEVLPTALLRSVPITETDTPDDNLKIVALEADLTWPRLEAKTEAQVLSSIIENFTINATNLISFLNVAEGGPATFLERSLLRLPSIKSDYMSHGTAVHAALELAQKQVNLGAFNLDAVKDQYRKTLLSEHIAKDKLDQQIAQGEKVLNRLFNDFDYSLLPGSTPEKAVKGIQLNQAIVGGKLDRIDFIDGNTIRIVDYKTGTGLTSFDTKDKVKEIKAWQHKLQLTFYALLASYDPEYCTYNQVEGQMVYVESEYQKGLTLSYTPSKEDIERLGKLVEAIWTRVKAYDLPDVSSYEQNLAGIKQFEDDLLSSK